jgi:hypothetical protein
VDYRLDLRVAGLARICHVNYTRNVDDLSFFWGGPGLGTRSSRFVRLAERIIRDEGYLPTRPSYASCQTRVASA